MPKLRNVASILLTFGPGDFARTGPEPWLPTGLSWSIAPNQEKVIFEDDYVKSKGLQAAVDLGQVVIVDASEPVTDDRFAAISGALTVAKFNWVYTDFLGRTPSVLPFAAFGFTKRYVLLPDRAIVIAFTFEIVTPLAGAGDGPTTEIVFATANTLETPTPTVQYGPGQTAADAIFNASYSSIGGQALTPAMDFGLAYAPGDVDHLPSMLTAGAGSLSVVYMVAP